MPRRNKINCFHAGSNHNWQPTVYTLVVMKSGFRLVIWGAILLYALPGFSQDAATGRALGVVTKVDAGARQLTLKTDAGEVAVSVDAKAKVLRVAPGATNLSNAAAIGLTDINVGDRLRARGQVSDGQKSLSALEIIVISQSDIAGKQAAERADWDRRGATGIVAEASADSITINVRTLEGVKPMAITAAPNAIVRRYTRIR